jgi:hypothetical protein
LSLDATKTKKKIEVDRSMNSDDEMIMMTEKTRQKVKQKKNDFVNQTEEMIDVMKNVCEILRAAISAMLIE